MKTSGHAFRSSHDEMTWCGRCGLRIWVRFDGNNRLRLRTKVYAVNSEGNEVQPSAIRCKPGSGWPAPDIRNGADEAPAGDGGEGRK